LDLGEARLAWVAFVARAPDLIERDWAVDAIDWADLDASGVAGS
jgi:hypothetical protein